MLLMYLCPIATGAAVYFMARGGIRALWQFLLARRPQEGYMKWAGQLGVHWDETKGRQAARSDLQRAAAALGGSLLLLSVVSLAETAVIAVLSSIGAYCIRGFLLRRKVEKRWARFEEDLPDALNIMVQSMRAGDALLQSIANAASRMPGPVSNEFSLIVRECSQGGLALEDALDRARTRIASDGFRMVGSALILGLKSRGSDLLDVLESLSDSIRSLSRLRRKMYVETSEVRMQQKVALFITPVFGMLAWMLEPTTIHILLGTFKGFAILLIVGVIQTAAVLSIRAIVRGTI